MAISMDFNVPAGLNVASMYGDDVEVYIKNTDTFVSGAYLKINSVMGGKESLEIELQIKKDKNSLPIMTQKYTFIPSVQDNSPNYHKQGYEYIKTLPEFAGAVDVLEDGQAA